LQGFVTQTTHMQKAYVHLGNKPFLTESICLCVFETLYIWPVSWLKHQT